MDATELTAVVERMARASSWRRRRPEPLDARAVFTTLREADGDQEFFDITVQPPPEYAVLWAHQPDTGARGTAVAIGLPPLITSASSDPRIRIG